MEDKKSRCSCVMKLYIVKKRLFIASMCIISLIAIVVTNLALRTIWDQSLNSSDILKQQRFIHSYDNNEPKFDMNVDLRKENYFGSNGVARKNKKAYDSVDKDIDSFQYRSNDYNISRLLTKPIPIKIIKKNNYKVVLNAKDILNSRLLALTKKNEQAYGDLEWKYQFHNLEKVRITYNHKYLPIKLESHYRGHPGWKYENSYDYPYHSEKEFNKDLDAYIEAIKLDAFSTK